MTDGMELVLMSIINPLLKSEWHLSFSHIELMTSLFYLGMVFGAVVTGNYADRFGRRRLIALSAVLQVAVKVAFSAVAGVASMYAVRFAVGFCFGFSLPLTTSMSNLKGYLVAEITPIEYRGKMLVIINFFLTLGKVLGCFLVYIFISPDLKSGNFLKTFTLF
jgi:putative MFS transporter